MSKLIINNHIITTPIINILEDIHNNTHYLDFIEEKSDYIRITCPYHNDGHEKKPSCSVYIREDTDIIPGTTHCFACGAKTSLVTLVSYCFGKSESWAKTWLISNYSDKKIESLISEDTLPPINLNQNNKKVISKVSEDYYQSWHPYMEKRKLSRSICEQFKVSYDPKSKCIVFPVWDYNNNLVMFTKRSVLSKHFYIDANIEKPVYLLNFIKERDIKDVIVVESQINCLYLWSLGYPAIALFGTGSKHQMDILNKSCIRHYTLAFDGDQAGDNGIKRFINNIRKDVLIDVIQIPRGKDVNDLSREEFNNLNIVEGKEYLYKYE